MSDSISAQHRYLANLGERDLLARMRAASELSDLVLWEMIGLSNVYTPVIAGPEAARKLDIYQGEIIGYLIPDGGGHFIGSAIGDAMVPKQNQAPPARDLIGTIRWKSRLAGGR